MLMVLLSTMLEEETENMLRNNIRFNVVGKIEDLPGKTRDWVLSTIEKTKNNSGLILTLALSYGGRQEFIDAFNSLKSLATLNSFNALNSSNAFSSSNSFGSFIQLIQFSQFI